MIGYWNDDEDAALQGLSARAQLFYLRVIAPLANEHGQVKQDRAAEEYRQRINPSTRALNRDIGELRAAGLVVGRWPAYHLPLATRGGRQ